MFPGPKDGEEPTVLMTFKDSKFSPALDEVNFVLILKQEDFLALDPYAFTNMGISVIDKTSGARMKEEMQED